MFIDFRALHEKTIGMAYSPILQRYQLGNTKYFSVFDLASDFHQILTDESDVQKTAFSTWYNFNRMSFRLKNASVIFQILMD